MPVIANRSTHTFHICSHTGEESKERIAIALGTHPIKVKFQCSPKKEQMDPIAYSEHSFLFINRKIFVLQLRKKVQ